MFNVMQSRFRVICLVAVFVVTRFAVGYQAKTMVWTGGALHLDCSHAVELMLRSGQYIRENVVATKVVSFKDDIFVLTPRLKPGVPATLSRAVRSFRGVELAPYPDLAAHAEGNCDALQNAVDCFLDHLGVLWVLDTGVVDSLEAPRCTCPPKVVAVNLQLDRITRTVDLSPLVPATAVLQTIVVDYGLGGKPFMYISEATSGAVLVAEAGVATGAGRRALVGSCTGARGLQLALVGRALLVVRVGTPGLLLLDAAVLRRQGQGPILEFGENSAPVTILGTDPRTHRVFLRRQGCNDVLAWNIDESYNVSSMNIVHAGSPYHMVPLSVASDSLKPKLLLLESNYGDYLSNSVKAGTFHRLTIIPKT